ncbi:tetratricopeptide repeat protein [Candidatus Shapirobacteria bacterium]|nr:tetratricopeptide repeat protein [Candidatus Shapirobacteria bacterium]
MEYLIVCLTGLALYAKSLFFDLTYLDDNVLILDNFYFIKNLGNIGAAFSRDAFLNTVNTAYYRPLLTISFIINSQFSGVAPGGYHLGNILLHLGAACLLYYFFKKLKYSPHLSLFLTLLFTVHPILAQAVAWIPGRNDSLLAIFVLASFIFLINFWENYQKKDLLYHLFFFFLALLSKESALIIPVIALLYLYLIKGEKQIIKKQKDLIFSWLGILTCYFFLRHWGLKNPINYGLGEMIISAFKNLPALVQFLGKIFFPFNLTVLPTLADTTFVYGIIAAAILILMIIFAKNKRLGPIIFGFIWFLLFLVPNFVRPDPTAIADFCEHRAYIPLIGILIILAEINPLKKFSFKNKTCLWGGITLLLFFSLINFSHQDKFKNRLVFWQEAAASSPSHPLAHRNLGAIYILEGQPEKAEEELEKALLLNPTEPMVHNNLGVIYLEKKMFDQAILEFQKELELYPFYDQAYFNLGVAYYHQKKLDEAEKAWLKTLEINPNYLQAYQNLAALYQEKNEPQKSQLYLNLLQQETGVFSPPNLPLQ